MTFWYQLLLKHHDGDDRCGCIREALALVLDYPYDTTNGAKEIIEQCIAHGHRGWPRNRR